MAIKYRKYQNNTTGHKSKGKYFLRAAQDGTLDLGQMAAHMKKHNTVFSRGQILGILTDFADCTKEMLLDSKKVKLNDFICLSLGFACNPADTAAEARPSKITRLYVNAQGTGEMAGKQLLAEASFTELAKYDGAVEETETVEDGETSNSGNGNQQQNQPGGSTGGQQTGGGSTPSADKVTIQWLSSLNALMKEMQVAVGGSIQQSDIPAATGSNTWDKNLTQINAELASAAAGSTITVKEQGDDF